MRLKAIADHNRVVRLEDWNGLDLTGTNDCTSILTAAITQSNSYGWPLELPAGIIAHSGISIVSTDYGHVRGAGRNRTYLKYTGITGPGITIKRTSSPPVLYYPTIENLSIIHADATGTKQGIQIEDVGSCVIDKVSVVIAGGNSCGIRTRGREFVDISRCRLSAPIPINIGSNPQSSPVGTLSADFMSIRSTDLQCGSTAPTTWPWAAVLVGEFDESTGALATAEPVHVTNLRMDTVAFVSGHYGLHWLATTMPSGQKSQAVSIVNTRKEQTPSGAGRWSFYVSLPSGATPTSDLWSLNIKDHQGESNGNANGLYVRGVNSVRLEEFTMFGGASTVVDADDVNVLEFDGVHTASSTTMTLGSYLRLDTSAQHLNGFQVPTHATWTEQSQYRNAEKPRRNGDLHGWNEYYPSLADEGSFTVPINGNVQSVVTGEITIVAAGTGVLEGMTVLVAPVAAGTNGIVLLSGTANTVIVSGPGATVDGFLNIYAGGASLASDVTIVNRLGVACNVQVNAVYKRSVET